MKITLFKSLSSQVLGPGALGRPRGIGWRGRWDGGSGWGIHVYPRLIHVNVWQKPLQYCKVISLQLIKKIKTKQNKQKNKSLSSPGQQIHFILGLYKSNCSFALLNFTVWYWNTFLNKCGYVMHHFNVHFSFYVLSC